MYLINNIHFILTVLWWNANLIYYASDVFYLIIRCSVELKNIEWHCIIIWRETIYSPGKNSCRSCFSDSSGTTKKVCLCDFAWCNSLFKSLSNTILSYHFSPILWTIFPCRDHVLRITHVANIALNRGPNKASFTHSTNKLKLLSKNFVDFPSITYFCAPF